MSEAKKFNFIGQRTIRPDGHDKVTGKANYAADLALPGMIWGKILRSPHAHAKILKLDTSKAEAMSGVMSVATFDDLPSVSNEAIQSGEGAIDSLDLGRNVLARDKVLYHGHAIAAIAAKTEAIAEKALELIDVEYEVLTPVLDLHAAMKADAPLLHEDMFTQGYPEQPEKPSNIAARHELKMGDVKAGFAEADVIVERDFVTPTVHQGYIEPHACTVSYNTEGQSMVWCSTQGHFDVRASTAKLLAMPLGNLKVIASEIGGGFGGWERG